MKIKSLSKFDLDVIQDAKNRNWQWWDEDGFPMPDPAELAQFIYDPEADLALLDFEDAHE
jgi:hypothetical protein